MPPPPAMRLLLRCPCRPRGVATARHFHASSPRHTLLDTTTALLSDTHASTGLGWAAVIPLTAAALRLAVVLPLTLYARSKTATIIRLLPLQSARHHHHARTLQRDLLPEAWETALKIAAKHDRDDLWRRWHCQRWKLYLPLAQLPVWLVASASIRALMPATTAAATAATAAATTTATTAAASSGLVDFLGGLSQPLVAGAEALASEGPPWCLNLTAADPTMALPATFAVAALANIRWQAYIDPPQTRGQKIWVNALSVVSVACFVVAASQPAGVVLYWASSALCGLGVNVALHRLWPLPPRIRACKRGMVRIDEVEERPADAAWFQWGGLGATTVPGGGGRIDK